MILRDQDVVPLDIPVNETVIMKVMNSKGYLIQLER